MMCFRYCDTDVQEINTVILMFLEERDRSPCLEFHPWIKKY